MPTILHAPTCRRIDPGVPGWRHALIGIVLLGLAAVPVPVAGQESDPSPSLPAVTATWSGIPIRTVARRLGELARRPVILDRRLDPDAPVTLDIRDAALVDVLEQIAEPLGASCAVLPASIRIVPGRAAATLVASDAERTRAIAALPLVSRRLAGRRAPWVWEDGARPRDLIERLADETGIDLTGLDDIPHDHLAAAELPALPLAERFDLLLAQFDRRIDWQPAPGGSERVELAIVPLPAATPAGNMAVVVAAGAVRGGPRVAPPPCAGGSRRPPAGTPTWTLEVAAPLDQLLQTIATRMELDLQLDREGLRTKGIAPAEIVRLSVKDVDRDTLLDRIVMPLGLEWAIDGRTLRVGPKAE
jgi:hypothetical protein